MNTILKIILVLKLEKIKIKKYFSTKPIKEADKFIYYNTIRISGSA